MNDLTCGTSFSTRGLCLVSSLLIVGLALAGSGCDYSGPGDVSRPPAPSNLEGTSGDAQVELSWEEVSQAKAYAVYRSTSSGIDPDADPLDPEISSTNFVDESAENETTYYYRVTASTLWAESEMSEKIQKTPRD